MRLNYQHLQAFHVVAQEGSISRAARRLCVSQPTLSQQLRTLELRHRAALFDGRKQPLRLTDVGRQLFVLTGRLFAISSEVESFFGALGEGKTRAVRLGSDSPIYAARLVAKFAERSPDAIVNVRIGNAREVMEWLRDGLADAGIGSDPPVDDAFHYLPLYRDTLAAAVPGGHPLARKAKIALSDLAKEALLVRERESRTRRASEMMFDVAGVKPSRVIEFHTREAIREAIALDLGVGLFYSAECPPDPRIAYRPVEAGARGPTFVGYLISHADQKRSPVMRTLFDAAGELADLSPLPL
jgi:DNA-binding transcriptional LysR family regulator